MKIAYFGLGKMGIGPALILQQAGNEVHTAVHRSREGAERLAALGGVIDASPEEAVRGADFIMSIVPDDAALTGLFLNEKMLSALQPGQLLIEMTSCSADAVQKVQKALAEKGVSVLDAPVSGGTAAANNGTMTMLCAGAKEDFERAEPLLRTVGKDIFFLSETVGDGKKIKSLNNLLNAVDRVAAGEVFRISKANGLDPDKVYEAISAASGNSVGFRLTWPRLISGDFEATFTVAHMRKDVNLARDLAKEAGLSSPIADITGEYYEKARPYDGEDSSAAAKVEL